MSRDTGLSPWGGSSCPWHPVGTRCDTAKHLRHTGQSRRKGLSSADMGDGSPGQMMSQESTVTHVSSRRIDRDWTGNRSREEPKNHQVSWLKECALGSLLLKMWAWGGLRNRVPVNKHPWYPR